MNSVRVVSMGERMVTFSAWSSEPLILPERIATAHALSSAAIAGDLLKRNPSSFLASPNPQIILPPTTKTYGIGIMVPQEGTPTIIFQQKLNASNEVRPPRPRRLSHDEVTLLGQIEEDPLGMRRILITHAVIWTRGGDAKIEAAPEPSAAPPQAEPTVDRPLVSGRRRR